MPAQSACKFMLSSARVLGTESNFVDGDRYCLSQNISGGTITFSKSGVILDGNSFAASGTSIDVGAGTGRTTIQRMLLGSGSIALKSSDNIVADSTLGFFEIKDSQRNQLLRSQVVNNTGTIALHLGSGLDTITEVPPNGYSSCNYFEQNSVRGSGNSNTRFLEFKHMLSNTFVNNVFELSDTRRSSDDASQLMQAYYTYFNTFRSNKFYITMNASFVSDGAEGPYQGAAVRLRNSSSFNQFIENEFRCNVRRCVIVDLGSDHTTHPRDNVFTGNRIYDTHRPFWAYGLLSGSTGNIFTNNLFYSQAADGFFADYWSNVEGTFRNNTFISGTNKAFFDDISGAKKLTFRNNLIVSKTASAFSPSNSPIDFKYNATTSSAVSIATCDTSGGAPVATPAGCNLLGPIYVNRPNEIGLDPTEKDINGNFLVDNDGNSFLPVGASYQTFGEGGTAMGYRPSASLDALAPNAPSDLQLR